MHISRLHKFEDEYLISFTEEDASRLGLIEGRMIEFTFEKIADPESSLSEEELAKVDRDYLSFKEQLERLG